MGRKKGDDYVDWESDAEERRAREEAEHARRQTRKSRNQEKHVSERQDSEAPAPHRPRTAS